MLFYFISCMAESLHHFWVNTASCDAISGSNGLPTAAILLDLSACFGPCFWSHPVFGSSLLIGHQEGVVHILPVEPHIKPSVSEISPCTVVVESGPFFQRLCFTYSIWFNKVELTFIMTWFLIWRLFLQIIMNLWRA